MNETQSESLPKPVESAQPTGIARRRLLRAGLAAGPVVLALSGRSAMAAKGDPCKGLSGVAWNSLTVNTTCTMNSHTVTPKTIASPPSVWKVYANSYPRDSVMQSTFSGVFGAGTGDKIKKVLNQSTNNFEIYFATAYCNVKLGSNSPIGETDLKTLYTMNTLAGKTLTGPQIESFLKQTWGNLA